MFKFYGSLSESVIRDSDKKAKKYIALVVTIVDLVAILVGLLCVFFVDRSYLVEMIALSIILIVISVLVLASKPKSISFRLPRMIIFDIKSQTITKQIESINKKPCTIEFSKIKHIYDYGEWYYIVFKGDITNYIVCQKSLLIEGDIKEFENIFKNQIQIKDK